MAIKGMCGVEVMALCFAIALLPTYLSIVYRGNVARRVIESLVACNLFFDEIGLNKKVRQCSKALLAAMI